MVAAVLKVTDSLSSAHIMALYKMPQRTIEELEAKILQAQKAENIPTLHQVEMQLAFPLNRALDRHSTIAKGGRSQKRRYS